MKHLDQNPQEALNQAIDAIRGEQAAQGTIEAASERVWQLLTQSAAAVSAGDELRGCAGVKSLLVQYRNNELSEARRLLVDAHLSECVECRAQAEKSSSRHAAMEPWKHELRPVAGTGLRWVMAAAAVVIIAVASYFFSNEYFSGPAGMRARVESFDGAIYRVGLSGEQPLKAGDEIVEGEKVRTGAASHGMLRLRDGSLAEMNERAELGVTMRRTDTTIQLDRGNIIVQAAKRKTGHLYVEADDVKVSVTGTVFSVNHGIKGSRVSVIEGEVRVAGTGADGVLRNAVLHPGEQMSTDAAGAVPVRQEIAWSRNLDEHLALLAEFAHLQNKLETVQMPGLRYRSKLLTLLPGNTVVLAAIPNLGDAVQQANQLFQQELQASPVLNEWWQQSQSRKHGPDYNQVIEQIHQLSQYLGEEIIVSVATDGHGASPLAIAQVQRPGLRQFIEQEAAKHMDQSDPAGLQIYDEASLATATSQKHQGLLMLVRADFVAASPDVTALRRFNAALSHGSGGFVTTPFGQRINAAYQQGVGLLFGADLGNLASFHRERNPETPDRARFEQTGFTDVRFLVAERKDVNGQPLNHAELSFNGPRHGVASWLAAPAPIGALDFISKDASAAGAFVSKNPSQMLDDILNIAGASGQADFAKLESQLGIQFRQDLADTLGGELTVALDGPILPTPSWKIVAEVFSPGRLQSTIQQLVNDVNTDVHDQSRSIILEQQTVSGLNYYRIRFLDSGKPAEINYAFTDGYMIVAPSRALVMNSIAVHQNGNSLARSDSFRALLPQDQHTDVSALIYQNLAPVFGPIMSQLTPTQLQSLQKLAAETKPSVVCAYGEPNAIRIASNSQFFGLDLNTMTLSTLLRIARGLGSPPTNAPQQLRN
jgi:hypothetical protein